MTYVITQSCCNDASCVDVCPVDCIHPTPDDPGFLTAEMLYIDPDVCIDCGSCVEACPVGAIHADFEVPDHLQDYTAMNADYFTWAGEPPDPVPLAPAGPRIDALEGPLRVAVVGCGPAGMFITEELVGSKRIEVQVTLLDRLATPHGLVRYGVAPDHLHTKEAVAMFDSIAKHRRVTMRLNVEVGADVTHEELLEHHHAVVYATGASEGRNLGLPGEELPGSLAAAEFVNWYNGHPDHADLDPRLDHERAVIIGNGNVALDIARVLLTGHEALHGSSDMAGHAVEALSDSGVDEVVVVGRRGPEYAAFTTPELLALVNHPGIDVVVDRAMLDAAPEPDPEDKTPAGFAAHQKIGVLRRAVERPAAGGKRLVFRFGLTPQELLGDDRVTGMALAPTGGDPQAAQTLEAGLVIRATGYRSTQVAGLPFDAQAGRFAHQDGRVLDPESSAAVYGTYTTGWVKRGPSGVIGSNRLCAIETAHSLLDDVGEGRLTDTVGDAESFDALLAERGVTYVDFAGWRKLDRHERSEGKTAGRPRLKVVARDEQVQIAVGPS